MSIEQHNLNKQTSRHITIEPTAFGYKTVFNAMASPCEVLFESDDQALVTSLSQKIADEAWRIEDKYSRYKSSSVCSLINRNAGSQTCIDQETFRLLGFAQQCYEISGGLFDVTSGILLKLWKFDGTDNIPKQADINKLLPHIGWHHVTLSPTSILLKDKMEIDLGGLGKEYAVDTCIQIAKQATSLSVLINFGGDIAVTGLKSNEQPWAIGVEHPGFETEHMLQVRVTKGAIATSGEARRYLLKNGKRLSHILNPKTGWPVENGPKSVTINAPNCIQAGFIATLSLLKGEKAEVFLTEEDISHWCIW